MSNRDFFQFSSSTFTGSPIKSQIQAIVSSATPNTDIDAPITMAVQSALNINFPHNKFMVICSPTGDDFGLIKENSVSEFPSKMQFRWFQKWKDKKN